MLTHPTRLLLCGLCSALLLTFTAQPTAAADKDKPKAAKEAGPELPLKKPKR